MGEVEKLWKAVNIACEILPEDWAISIRLEQGCADVYLSKPDGTDIDMAHAAPDFSFRERIEYATMLANKYDPHHGC